MRRLSPQQTAQLIHHRREHVRRARGRRPPRRRPLPRPLWPSGIARSYFGALRAVLARARAILERHLGPQLPRLLAEAARLRGDAEPPGGKGPRPPPPPPGPGTDASRLVDRARDELDAAYPPAELASLAAQVGNRVSDYQREQLQRQLRAAVGVDFSLLEPWLPDAMSSFAAENVALIKSLSSDYFADIEKRLFIGLRTGMRAEELAGELEERYGASESRAQLIARDQVGKLYGGLNEFRQRDLGIQTYIWRSMGDEKVRPEHALRDGKEFAWSDPPADGHPGEPVQCRCWSEPVMDEILDELDVKAQT